MGGFRSISARGAVVVDGKVDRGISILEKMLHQMLMRYIASIAIVFCDNPEGPLPVSPVESLHCAWIILLYRSAARSFIPIFFYVDMILSEIDEFSNFFFKFRPFVMIV